MKRLGDFLNLESFDLALLQEVGRGDARWEERWLQTFPKGRARQTASPFLPPRCGVSRTSST